MDVDIRVDGMIIRMTDLSAISKMACPFGVS